MKHHTIRAFSSVANFAVENLPNGSLTISKSRALQYFHQRRSMLVNLADRGGWLRRTG
jgi:hypothetical protein